jgi:hypothetical protein
MEFKEVMRWRSDNYPESTDAVVVVSRCGVVKRLSFKHWNQINGTYSTRKDHVYPQTTNRGKGRFGEGNYLTVAVRKKSYSVHRLVAMAWIENPNESPQVNHKDGNKQNNHADNLEWVTNLENLRHGHELGLFHPIKGEKHGKSKLTDAQVVEIKQELKDYRRGLLTQLARRFGVLTTTISEIKAGRSWGHVS